MDWASNHCLGQNNVGRKNNSKNDKANYITSKCNKLIYKKIINLYNNKYELCVNAI